MHQPTPGRERVGEAKSEKKKKVYKEESKQKKHRKDRHKKPKKRDVRQIKVCADLLCSFPLKTFSQLTTKPLGPLPVSAVDRLEPLQHKCSGLKTVSLLDLNLKCPKQFLYFGVKWICKQPLNSI